MNKKFEIDLNPLTIHFALKHAEGEEYTTIRDNIEEITRLVRDGTDDDASVAAQAREMAGVIESILNDPEFIKNWKEPADLLITEAA